MYFQAYFHHNFKKELQFINLIKDYGSREVGMKIENILKEFVKESVSNLNLKSIVQFGSSTYSKNFDDIDLVFVFNDDVIKTTDILKSRELIKKFEKKYKEIVFDFGSIGTRERKARYSITVVLRNFQDLNIRYNPHDTFFLKNLRLDKNLKVLYGNNPFKNLNIKLINKHLFEMLSVDLKNTLRRNLDDEIDKEFLYRLFKTCLRIMLINYGFFEKDKLLVEFENKFGNKIKLPKNSEDIVNNRIKDEDFKDILIFAENCLKYLIK